MSYELVKKLDLGDGYSLFELTTSQQSHYGGRGNKDRLASTISDRSRSEDLDKSRKDARKGVEVKYVRFPRKDSERDGGKISF